MASTENSPFDKQESYLRFSYYPASGEEIKSTDRTYIE